MWILGLYIGFFWDVKGLMREYSVHSAKPVTCLSCLVDETILVTPHNQFGTSMSQTLTKSYSQSPGVSSAGCRGKSFILKLKPGNLETET